MQNIESEVNEFWKARLMQKFKGRAEPPKMNKNPNKEGSIPQAP